MTTPATAPTPAIPLSYDQADTRHPRAFWFFFWGEFAERCSYYGMRAILPLYVTAALHFSDTTGGQIVFAFKMACYFLPLLGGYLADRYFGKYWTIVGFSVPYVLGHFILGIGTPLTLAIALALLAGGSGVIKPNISTLMGQTYDQQRPGQEQLRSVAFLWFYFSINIGSLLSMLAMPVIRNRHGYAVAFQFPAWIMVAALIVFALGKPYYSPDPPVQVPTEEERRLRWQTLRRLLGVFALFIFFWIGYEQSDAIWIYFMRDHVSLNVPLSGWSIAPDQLLFINPLIVVICVPLFGWLFRKLDPRAQVITAVRKIFAGFLFAAAAPALFTLAAALTHGDQHRVSLGWPVAAWIVLTLGEILFYGTGLELAYAAAPSSMKSFVTACFLLTSALGDLVDMWFFKLYGTRLSPASFFGITAGITLAAGIVFLFVGRRLEQQPPPKPRAGGFEPVARES